MDVFLESNVNLFDIVFIQEPPWRHIRSAPSAHNKEGEDVVGPPMHPAWKLLMRPPQNGVPPRVIAYVSTRLNSWRPAIRRDLVDHRDLLLLSLFLEGSITYLLNVYSDEEHTAIRFLADKQDDIPQLDYMGGDFNCHSNVWDGNVPHHRTTAISLLDSAASLGLDLALPLDPGPTHYPHDRRLRPSVIDLVFVHPDAALPSNVRRLTDLRGPSDHVPLGTSVPVGTASRTALPVKLPDDSVEQFLSDVSEAIKAIDVAMLAPTTPDQVEALAQSIASAFRSAWDTHAAKSFIRTAPNLGGMPSAGQPSLNIGRWVVLPILTLSAKFAARLNAHSSMLGFPRSRLPTSARGI